MLKSPTTPTSPSTFLFPPTQLDKSPSLLGSLNHEPAADLSLYSLDTNAHPANLLTTLLAQAQLGQNSNHVAAATPSNYMKTSESRHLLSQQHNHHHNHQPLVDSILNSIGYEDDASHFLGAGINLDESNGDAHLKENVSVQL